MRTTRHAALRRLLVTFVAVPALLAACGSDAEQSTADTGTQPEQVASTSPGDTAPEGTEATSASTTDSTAASDDVATDPNATFRWITSTDAPSMDPHRVSATFYIQHLMPVYDRLLYLNPDGSVSPMLATEWEFIDDPGPAIEMTLRDDVTFHSGAHFDANAVKANIERALTMPDSLMKNDLAAVDSVEVIDPTHVRFMLNRPAPGLLQTLADRAGMMIDPAAFDSPDLATMGAGSGPWKVVERVPDSHTTYEKFADYWDPNAQQFGQLEILIVSDDESRLNAVLSGQADAMELRPAQVSRAEAQLEITKVPVARSYQAVFNTGMGDFADPKVRVALQYAVDRQAISDTILTGGCTAAVQAAPSGHLTHAEDVEADYFPYDPDRARELLAEAGAEGISLKALVANQPIYVQIAETLQAYFAEVGVDLTLEPIPSNQINELFNQRQEGHMVIQQTAPSADPSQAARGFWTADGFWNPGKQTTPEIEALVDTVSVTPPGPDLETAWNDLTKATRDFGFDMIICNQVQIFGANSKVQGLQQNLLGSWYDFRAVAIAAE